MQGRWLIPGTT